MTNDYDLLEGDTLVLNCSLYSHSIRIGKSEYFVNSSNLIFRKGSWIPSEHFQIVDDLTAQLRIDAATVNLSGVYLCEMAIPELKEYPVVCGSQVNIGYPPKPVKNFKCISMYRENLTCTWDVEKTFVRTKYTLSKNFFLAQYFQNPPPVSCPATTSNNTFCQWGENTDPPFRPEDEEFTFVLQGKNSLGNLTQNFTMRHGDILLPNHPEMLTVSVDKRSMSLHWSPPEKMKAFMNKPPLKYEIWMVEMVGEYPETKVIEAGNDVLSYTVYDLIPHMMYNISVRCRSAFAPEHMWSPFISIQQRTLPDVPYVVPTFTKEAFELHHFDGYRTVTLYWQPVLKKHYNSDNFAYHVICSYNNLTSSNTASVVEAINVTSLSVSFGSLQEDCSYRFQIFSMNDQGLSSDFKLFVLDTQQNIPDLPEAITAVSHNAGHYELSWKPPKSKHAVLDYMVFWCSGLKPWLNRCDDQIHWLNTSLNTNHVLLNLSDNSTNYQFAVAARGERASSGLQWATCIVPFEGALGKITNVIVEPKNSTSLKIMWRLDCAAQKIVVKKFEIVYCLLNEQNQCEGSKESVEIDNSNVESYLLQGLVPFSNYSVIIRAYNHADRASEESDAKIQATLQGAPSDPPQDVEAFAIPNASILVSWRPPVHPNGVITHYQVRYNSQVASVAANSTVEAYDIDLQGLLHYTNYSIGVEACVVKLCSLASGPTIIETDVGAPSAMDPPRIEPVNSTLLKVSWNLPLQANGPLAFYEVQWVELQEDNTTVSEHIASKNVTAGLSSLVEISCDGFVDGGIKYLFSVRAVNVRGDGMILYGLWSDPTEARACLLSQGVAMFIGAAIGGTLTLALLVVLIYKSIRWMSDKIQQMKSITVCLPDGLDGIENNPLKNYENADKSLLQQSTKTAVISRISHSANDVDSKNRHGSGNSQYSFSSTDELLYRYGKCTKYARKPSGESSGCSSMSSSITKAHLSSESSTESDFMTPPSPDLVFTDHVALPIVHEDKDSLSLDEVSKKSLTNDESSGCDGIKKMVLENEPPYSKFGISRCETSLPPWWINSLAFYSVNLSNSEPSVKDVAGTVPMCMPYSKVGVTKSSENVIGLRPADFNLGYSRIGIIPNRNDAVLHSLALPSENGNEKYTHGLVIIPSSQPQGSENQYCHSRTENENILNNSSLVYFNSSSADSKISEESGYIKFRRTPLQVKSGYVPLNNLDNFDKSPYPLLALPVGESMDLAKGEVFPEKGRNSSEVSEIETSLQPLMEYNPEMVSVIFNDNLSLNGSSQFGYESECKEPNSANKSLLHESFGNSVDPGVVNGLSDASTNGFNGVPIDLCSIANDVIPSFDSQPLARSESKSSESVHSSDSDLKTVSSCPASSQLEPDASPPVDRHPVRNGYVSFSTLSNMNSSGSVPKHSVPSGNGTDQLRNLSRETPVSNPLPEVSDNYPFRLPPVKRKNSIRSSKYKVYPLLDSIPQYSRSCKNDSYERPRYTSVSSNEKVFEFMPTRGSEFCEV